MKFSGQKFFIFLGFFLVPVLFVGALLREPVVNRGLLRVTLGILKRRLGTSIKARTWKVDLSKFAVAVEGIEFTRGKLVVSAKEVRAEFSPLFLLIGRLYLSRVWIDEAVVEGVIPKLKEKTRDEKPFNLEGLINEAGEGLVDVQQTLDQKKIGFEVVEVSSLSVKTDLVQIKESDLKIENFGTGHLKVELVADEVSGEPTIPKVSRVLASVVLYRDRSKTYLSIRRLNAELSNDSSPHSTFELKGRLPGDITVELMTDLTQMRKWLRVQKNPKLLAWSKENTFAGYAEISGTAVAEGAGLKKANGHLHAKNLHWNDFSFAELESDFEVVGKTWNVVRSKGRFFPTPMDVKAKNEFAASNLHLVDDKLVGDVRVARLGLCAMLRGLGVSECYLDLVMSGKITLSGAIQNLKLTPELDLDLEPFTVWTDPDEGKGPKGRLLKTKAAKLKGTLEIRDSDLDITHMQLSFGANSSLWMNGNLKYKPARLFIKAGNDSARLDEVLQDFLEEPVSGTLKGEATIDYDFQRAKDVGRTDVFVDYLIKDLGIAGLPMGDVTGKAQFLKKIFEFRPTVRFGPGTLKVVGRIGRLDPAVDDGQMSIYANANDYEVLVPRKHGSPIFDAVLNFETHLAGSLDKTSARPFGGNLDAVLHSITSFGIPFEKGSLKAFVDLTGIKIDRLEAFKGDSKTVLTGFLGGNNKSRVEFSSQPLPIRQLGYDVETERIVQTGDVAASGWWSEEKGFAIDAQCHKLRVGQASFPELAVRFASSQKVNARSDVEAGIFISAKATDQIDVRYDSLDQNLSAKLKDSGIFLALSLLNKWETVPEFLKIKGDVDVQWAPTAGKVVLKDLDFQVTDRWNRQERRLLHLDAPSEILYRDGVFQGHADFVSGISKFAIKSRGDELVGDGKMGVRLIDLFIPDVVRLVDGEALFHAHWKPQSAQGLQATVSFDDMSAYLPFIGTELRAIQGSLGINGTELTFNGLNGRSGEGSFDLSGSMLLPGGAIKLKAFTKSLPVRIGHDVDLVVTGDFEIAGETTPYALQGHARIERGLLRKEFSEAGIRTAMLDKPWVTFAIPFEVLPNFQLKNSLTDAFISGQGALGGNNLAPSVSGRFDVVKGTLFAKDNEFAVSYARVVVPKDTDIDPIMVNVQASTIKTSQSIDYQLYLSAEGDPNNLKLNFRSDPSLTQKQIIALLTLGYLPQDQTITPNPNANANANNQGSTIAQSASAEAFQLLFGQALGKGIQKQTGFDVRVGTSANLKQDDTIPKVTVYRRLNNRMSATFGRSLDVSRPENNFKIDYHLLNNLNLTGVWENPEENRHSLGLDLRLEFDIK